MTWTAPILDDETMEALRHAVVHGRVDRDPARYVDTLVQHRLILVKNVTADYLTVQSTPQGRLTVGIEIASYAIEYAERLAHKRNS